METKTHSSIPFKAKANYHRPMNTGSDICDGDQLRYIEIGMDCRLYEEISINISIAMDHPNMEGAYGFTRKRQ